MARRELQHDVGGRGAGFGPAGLAHKHGLAVRVAGILVGVQTHGGCLIEGLARDVAIVYRVGGAVDPSCRRAAIFHHHGAHTLGCDVAMGVLVTLLQVEHDDAVVGACHCRSLGKAVLAYAVLRSWHTHAVVKSQGLGTQREGHAQVQGRGAFFGAGDGLFHRSQKDAAGSKHLDVHHAQHFASLDVGLHFGTVARAMHVAIHRGVGLDHAHHLSHHVAGAPWRAAQVHIGLVAVELLAGAYLVEGFGFASYHSRLVHMAHDPRVEIAVFEGHKLACSLHGLRHCKGQGQCN